MLRKPPEPHAARWHNFPGLEKYFASLEPPHAADPMDGWPGVADAGERVQEEEKYLRQLLCSLLQLDTLNRPSPDPADMKALYRDLETLGLMCDHFARIHESTGEQIRTMRREVSEKIAHWLSRV